MPRKTPAQRKANVSAEVSGEDIKTTKGSTPRRSGRAAAKTDDSGQEAERSRRSSTAAQTAASVAESRVTRSGRNPKRESSSPAADKSQESLVSRARSSRRSAQNVNYKESDGEEEVPTPKNEENFESNEEFDESDSDEKNKKKIRKGRSPQKGRGSKPKPRAAAKGGKRGRPTRRKKESEEEEEEEDEEEETVEISDDSNQIDSADVRKKEGDSASETKQEEKTGASRRKARAASASVPPTDSEESAEKRGRRSCRSTAAKPAPTPSKRPSRNKQIKKYTEVEEEDFSDVKSEEEDYETEVKKESSRKRKRETEVESNKRPRREKPETKVEEPEEKPGNEEEEEDEARGNKESEVKKPTSEAKETVQEQTEEPMEVDEKPLTISTDSGKDESLPESKDVANREAKKVPEHEKVASAPEKAEDMDGSKPPHTAEAVEEPKKEAGGTIAQQAEKPEVKEPQPEPSSGTKVDGESGKSRESACSEGEALNANSKESDSISPMEQDTQNDDVSKPVDSVPAAQSRDDTFLSKDQVPAASVNGEDTSVGKKDSVVPAKDTSVPDTDSSFQHQNSTVPNTNGAREELEDEKRTVSNDVVFPLPCRQFIFNRYVGEDIRSSLKDGTFGIVSYNVSSGTASADKLIKELDKLQASIICLQEVSKTLFTEAIESKLDVLGYKAVSNSPWSENGLVTFYKTSAFRITNVVDVPLQKLISEALESSNLEESEKQAVSQCFDKCGSVLITQLATVLGSHAVTVANVRIPPCSMSLNALQVSCVTRKIATMREHIKPVLICGEFNLSENEVPYHLLKNGYLTDRMVEELKSRTDGSECASLIKLLQKVCQNPSCAMSSCYGSVLGKELELPKSKATSPDIVWASADTLHVIGVLDVASDPDARESDHRISLKADVAFFM